MYSFVTLESKEENPDPDKARFYYPYEQRLLLESGLSYHALLLTFPRSRNYGLEA